MRALLASLLLLAMALPREAQAIPAFARQTEMSCTSCHEGHFPRLNSLGRQFRDNGYQLPDGGQPATGGDGALRRVDGDGGLDLPNVPLSLRAQTFGVVQPSSAPPESPLWGVSVFSFLLGGGSIADDVSYYFAWTPYPTTGLHHARVGVHNILEERIGAGTLNLRAGSFFLLDFARPGHRFLMPGADGLEEVAVGRNSFSFAEPQYGVEVYGRPGWGSLHYELAAVAGDAPGGTERDNNVDAFGRLSWTLFRGTGHELTAAAFGYMGRSDFSTTLGGVVLAQRDEFWVAGGDVDALIGPVSLSLLGLHSRHSDAISDGSAVAFSAFRTELLWASSPRWTAALRFEEVLSSSTAVSSQRAIAPHVAWLLAPNAYLGLTWRQDLLALDENSAVLVLDVTL